MVNNARAWTANTFDARAKYESAQREKMEITELHSIEIG